MKEEKRKHHTPSKNDSIELLAHYFSLFKTKQVKPGFTTYQPQLNNFREGLEIESEIEETTTKNNKKQ